MDLKLQIEIKKNNKSLVNIDNYTIADKKITFLFGESGIGKSLISKAIFGLLDPEDLDIKINKQDYLSYIKNKDTGELIKNGFFVFQEPSTHLHPLITLEEQLNEGQLSLAESEVEDLKKLWKGTDSSHLKNLLKIYPKPYRPSGGEKQRVLCLMALKKINLMQNNKTSGNGLFVFDEPTGNLDNYYRDVFLAVICEKFIKKPFTVTFITHDYSIISFFHKNFKNLLPFIEFNELYSENNKLSIRNFLPAEYLNWVKSIAVRVSGIDFPNQQRILRFDKDFAVFGKNMAIFKNNTYTVKSDLIIEPGDLVYFKAPSGVGKTTFAKIILGLTNAHKFNFELDGISINEQTHKSIWKDKLWGKIVSMVFQHADEALNQKTKVKEVFDGLKIKNESVSVLSILSELFDTTMLSKFFLNKKVANLSGGQKQKLNLLRGFALNAKLLILDEPVNGMDFESIKKVITMIDKKRKLGMGILLISHNEEIFDTFVPDDKKYYLKVID
ncbi:MAG: ATP-binding cassette domain-containing protein [bacterium]